MNVPRLSWIPKNSASSGIGAVEDRVSGPRTVRYVVPACLVTTISQWVSATEMNVCSGSLRVRQSFSTSGAPDAFSSKRNS